MSNDLGFVLRVLDVLESAGTKGWVFGGWAEELRGAPARAHKDVDILCPGEDFSVMKKLFRSGQLEEIVEKRSVYKRAFLLDGIMVELFLAQKDIRGLFTTFKNGT